GGAGGGEGGAGGGDRGAGGAVDQDGVGAAGGPGEHERLPCHGRRAADDRRGSRLGAAVGSQHDVGVEDGDEGGEVALAGGSEEGVDDLPLAGEVADVPARALDPAACPAC